MKGIKRTELQTIFVYLHPDVLAQGGIYFIGLNERDRELPPASIEHLRLDIPKQNLPWDLEAHLVVEEGRFQWDAVKKDYIEIVA
ncbi:hypothetical protein AB3N02_23785 [Priestia aryabhattai]|jgi:hypothetical protein|uniref:hypothetical protein n=1 Tax=Priestia TaxID=2800373 RepID=UPI00203B5B54|nr:hypothetical protein [Priestia aryabhattai]MCM3773579.1 hypothetical protein [Priestia aryabhattai]